MAGGTEGKLIILTAGAAKYKRICHQVYPFFVRVEVLKIITIRFPWKFADSGVLEVNLTQEVCIYIDVVGSGDVDGAVTIGT